MLHGARSPDDCSRAVSDDRRWRERDEVVQGAVSTAAHVDPEAAKGVHDGLRMQVAAGSVAGEQIHGVGAGGLQVGAMFEEFVNQHGEWRGNGCGIGAEANPQLGGCQFQVADL